jgi:hypothetical protein
MSETASKFLGPSFNYRKLIKSPKEMGMNDDGNFSQVKTNIGGVLDYGKLLTFGEPDATKSDLPLGNRFFIKTPGDCKDDKTDKVRKRWFYVDNIPSRNLPMRGLIPGIISKVDVLNPVDIYSSLNASSVPPCKEVTLQTVLEKNGTVVTGDDTHYIANIDLDNIHPCNFMNGKNPITRETCNEGFKPMLNGDDIFKSITEDPLKSLYFTGIGGVLIYIGYMLLNRK